MFGWSSTESVSETSAALRSAVDEAMAVDVHPPTAHELTQLVADFEVELNRLAAAQRRVIAELDSRGVAGEVGSRSTADVIAQLLHVSPYESRVRVQAARTFGARRSLTGQPLAPVVPIVAAALDAGTVSLAHANVIADLLDTLPGDIEAEHGEAAQRFLLDQAVQVDPPTLRKLATRLRDTLDQDGADDRLAQINRNRSFSVVENADGSYTPRGRWTPALTTAVLTALDPLAAPRPSEVGERDPRSYGQRMHDALLEATKLLLRSGELPQAGGVATTILATVTIDQLRTGLGTTTNAYGHLLPVSELAKLAVEAEIIPVVFDDLGGVLAYGRARRTAPPALRRALAARDKGCIMPGCTRPPSQTEAHHVTEWAHGGHTNIDTMALLCDYDHDTFEARGWTIAMHHGVPWCTPPEWLDPDQTPRRNTAHDQMLMPLPEEFTPSGRSSVPRESPVPEFSDR